MFERCLEFLFFYSFIFLDNFQAQGPIHNLNLFLHRNMIEADSLQSCIPVQTLGNQRFFNPYASQSERSSW